jgi:hypothetical protein
MRILVIVFALFVQFTVKGQPDSTDVRLNTIKWHSKEFLNPATKGYTEMTCSFITYEDKKIVWDQRNGKVQYEMTIKEIKGTWKDVYKKGSIEYTVDMRGTPGKISIARDGDWITLKMDFKRGEGRDLNYEFIISTFERL